MSTDEAEVFTDSQWALDTFALVVQNSDFRDHVMRDNSDLIFQLCQLARVKQLHRFTMHKVKSHVSDNDVQEDLQLYHVFGNRVADLAAGRGTEPNVSRYNAIAHDIGKWMAYQKSLLHNLQPFLISAYQLRLDAVQRSSSQSGGRSCFDLTCALDWNPEAMHYYTFEPIHDKILRGFLPGASVFLCILQWAATLQWPAEEGASLGISSYELLCHFVGTTHCQLPRPINPGEQYLEYVEVDRDRMATLLHESPWEAVRILESAFTYARRFLGVHTIPAHVGKAQRAYLAMFGYKKPVAGYKCRPVLPELVEHLHGMTRCVSEAGLLNPCAYPGEPLGPRVIHLLDQVPHKERLKHFRSLQKEMSIRGRIDF
eukprot:Skav226485  [mRNA]  locus=scaffold744:23334:24446:+ [translate_table: standard]